MHAAHSHPRQPTVLTRLASFFSFLILCTLLAWLLGRLLSDRWLFSQFLLWIPTPFVILLALINLLFAFRKARSPRTALRRRILGFALASSFLAYFLLFEHHIFTRPDPSPPGLKLVHWNMTQPPDQSPAPGAALNEKLIQLHADITVMTSPGGFAWDSDLLDQLHVGRSPAFLFPTVVLSRFPVIQYRPLIAADGLFVSFVQLDASPAIPRPLTLYVVDFLSRPTVPRMGLARRVRDMLDQLDPPPPKPDLIVGDMNIPRGSASLQVMFPGFSHAYDQAGHGYSATFERRLPLYHIDHVLLAPPLRATRYDTLDLGFARHRAQVCWIQPASSN